MKGKVALIVSITLLYSVFAGCDGFIGIEDEEQGEENNYSDNEGSIDEAEANNIGDHDDPSDYIWDISDVAGIHLNGSSVSENTSGASANGTILTITSAGNYSFSGALTNGQIIVNTEDEGIVRLILNGVDITCSSSAPVYVKRASRVIIVLNKGTENYLTDGNSYNYDDSEEGEPNAVIFSKSDLTVYGEGSLTVNGNFNDGISGKDGLVIASGKIAVVAKDDGIRGKDYLVVKDGDITVEAGGDGFKSDNDNDEGKGYIKVIDGNITITSEGDAITAQSDILIEGGIFNLETNGSAGNYSQDNTSVKGIKAGVNIIIDKGVFTLNTSDDAIHSDETITINGGDFYIASGDDGIHSDYTLVFNGGNFEITKSYEGIESADGNIYFNSGNFNVVSSDDGINLAAGGDQMGGPGQGPGWNSSSSSECTLFIGGENMVINANGDGIDANGSVEMSGGELVINGPVSNGNGALDYYGSFKMEGGFLIAVGSSGMAEAPSTDSGQNSVKINFRSTEPAGTLVHLQSGEGEEIFTFKPEKKYQSVVFSSPKLKTGQSYDFYLGGSATGTPTNGLYSKGAYTPGTKYTSFTISGVVTNIR